MGSTVRRHPRTTSRGHHGQSRERQNHHACDEDIECDELHLGNANLVTEICRRTTYHQGTEEDGG